MPSAPVVWRVSWSTRFSDGPEDRAADDHRGPGDRLAGVLVHDRPLVVQRLPGILGVGGRLGDVLHGLGPLRGVIGGRWRGAEAEPRGDDDHDGRGRGGGEAPGGPAAALQRFVVLHRA